MKIFSKCIFPIIILAAAIILVAVLVLVLPQGPKEQTNNNNQPQPPEQPEVKSCIGLITKIDQAGFEIKAEANKNYFDQDTDLVILVNGSTQYSKLIAPTIIPADVTDISSLMKLEPIQFSDLKVGDEVLITSQTNIRGQSSFTADTVRVMAAGS